MKTLVLIVVLLCGCGGHAMEPAKLVEPPVVQTIPRHFDTVIIGDSLMEHWWYDSRTNWPVNAYPAGIGGQTTAQMLARFKDVLDLTPHVVVIEGGINDLYFNHALDQSIYLDMAVQAQTSGACVVLINILPTNLPYDLTVYNAARAAMAASYGFKYVDAYSTLVVDGKMNPAYDVGDGIHMNVEGYKILAPLVQAAIEGC